jgi:hypothetical protein
MACKDMMFEYVSALSMRMPRHSVQLMNDDNERG